MVFQSMLQMLEKNKVLPYYAAERRIDLFINLFIEEILSSYFGEKVIFVAPEFPLKLGTNNQADKLDYLCAFEGTKQPVFVELKTDTISFRKEQIMFYLEQALAWEKCITSLNSIISNKGMVFSYREKYFRLLARLRDSGLIKLTRDKDQLFEKITEMSKKLGDQKTKSIFSRGVIKLSEGVEATWENEAKLIYLVPTDEGLISKIQHIIEDSRSKDPRFERLDTYILDFTGMGKLDISPNMPFIEEYRQLASFLKEIK
jgi:hypothetical protein